jgi:hypothetical protein
MVGFFAVTVSAFAFGLSDEDYDYLKTQHIERDAAPMLDLRRGRVASATKLGAYQSSPKPDPDRRP